MSRGQTQLQSNHLRNDVHKTWGTLHLKRRSTDSSSAKHMGQALTSILFRRWRWSNVRILLRKASHPKAITLEGPFIFHWLCNGLVGVELIEAAEKNDATENTPSNNDALASVSGASMSGYLDLFFQEIEIWEAHLWEKNWVLLTKS